MKPYHLTVVELPSKYPGTLFAIHDARTNSLQATTWHNGKTEVTKYEDRNTAGADIHDQRMLEAKRAMFNALILASEGFNTVMDNMEAWTPAKVRQHLCQLQEAIKPAIDEAKAMGIDDQGTV